MAEAAVEASTPTRFYCHMCNVEINIPNRDFTCPLCTLGFIEELPSVNASSNAATQQQQQQSPTVSTSGLSFGRGTATSDMTPGGGGIWPTAGIRRSASQGNVNNRMVGLDTLRGEIATFLMSRGAHGGPNNLEIAVESPTGERLVPSGSNLVTFAAGGQAGGGGVASGSNSGVTVSGPAGGRVRGGPAYDRLDNVLFDFLQTLSGGDVDGMFGNTQMFFMGNPGDYAWGREGIDTIVTQLLNQMETCGPPPLAKDKIAEIPKVAVTSEETDRKLQCSVCWEDFRLAEIVRKLPCTHMYHENCIVPWLDLHGTCPICRKSLTGDIDGGEDPEDRDGDGGVITSVDNLFHPVFNNSGPAPPVPPPRANNQQSGNASQTSTASTSASQQQQPAPAPHNNIFGFDDGRNIDLD